MKYLKNKYILIYTNYAAPYSGNFFASMKALENELIKSNIGLIYMIPVKGKEYPWVEELKNGNNYVAYIEPSTRANLYAIKSVLIQYNILFIHTHFISRKQLFELKVALILARVNAPVVEHFHNHYVYNDNSVKQCLKKFLMKNDCLVACGSGVADSLIAGKLKNDISYIDNAIDFKRLDNYTQLKREVPMFKILMFGFDFFRKGVDLALQACGSLIEKYPQLRLMVCISINREYIENQIIKMFGDMPSWVELLQPRGDIATYYHDADTFISPSREEGLCYSLIEAGYCYCPIIASQISGQIEINMPSITWCKPRSIHDLAEKIESKINLNIKYRNELANLLHKSAVENYQIDRWVREIMDYYKEKKLVDAK